MKSVLALPALVVIRWYPRGIRTNPLFIRSVVFVKYRLFNTETDDGCKSCVTAFIHVFRKESFSTVVIVMDISNLGLNNPDIFITGKCKVSVRIFTHTGTYIVKFVKGFQHLLTCVLIFDIASSTDLFA